MLRNVAEPRPPKAEEDVPPPMPAMPPSFPGWRRITRIMKIETNTWMMTRTVCMRFLEPPLPCRPPDENARL